MNNSAADSWAAAADAARALIADLVVGDYIITWEEDDLSDSVLGEVRRQLRERDLAVYSDDRGLRVVAR